MILTVQKDRPELEVTGTARLHYEAKLYLRDETVEPPLASTEVGVVQSYRIDKATAAIPRSPRTIQDMPWVEQFLWPDHRFPYVPEVADMAYLLQTVYAPNGMPYEPETFDPDPSVVPFLRDDTLIYIRLVAVHRAYQGQGLSKALLDTYYHSLRSLPECKCPS